MNNKKIISKPIHNDKSINLNKNNINDKVIKQYNNYTVFISNKQIAQKYVYNTKRWKNIRLHKLYDNPLCEECLSNDKIVPAVQVHHIIPFMSVWNGSNLFEIKELGLDYNNLQSLCEYCHQMKHID